MTTHLKNISFSPYLISIKGIRNFSYAKSVLALTLITLFSIHVSGCAIYYRDSASGAEHIWGIGHLATKITPPADGKQTVITRATLMGIAVGMDNGDLGFSAGWDHRERLIIYDENTSVAITRHPSNDFFLFKIGSNPPGFKPFDTNSLPTNKPKETAP